MSRSLRVHAPGVAVHVMSRGNNKAPIFLDATDYNKYLALLALALERFGVTCHAFCLLWNHLHLLVTPFETPLWRLMQQVNSTYCEWFNLRYRRVGHVLQGRYKAKLVDEASYFLDAVRYLALNPVVARRVERPEDWPWSSYRAAIGLCDPEPFIDDRELSRVLDADSTLDRRERLVTFVTAGASAGDGWRDLIAGSAQLKHRIDPLLMAHKQECDFSYAHRYATRPPLPTLFAGRDGEEALHEAAYEAFCRHAYTLREIADLVDRHPGTIWIWVRRVAAARG